jgi:hypothetical protein
MKENEYLTYFNFESRGNFEGVVNGLKDFKITYAKVFKLDLMVKATKIIIFMQKD